MRPRSSAALWALWATFVLASGAYLYERWAEARYALGDAAWPGPEPLVFVHLAIALAGGLHCRARHLRGSAAMPGARLAGWLASGGALLLAVTLVNHSLTLYLHPAARWGGGAAGLAAYLSAGVFLLLVPGHPGGRKHNVAGAPAVRVALVMAKSLATLLLLGPLLVYLSAPALLGEAMGLRRGVYPVRVLRGVEVAMADGTLLATDVYLPRRAASTPGILVRIPLPRSPVNLAMANALCRLWAERGYTVVYQVIRGYPPSQGRFEPFRHERSDGESTLAWLAERPWFDGRLALWGGSYFGYTQWALADRRAPGPSALFVQISSTDWHAMLYPGGAFSLTSALHWAVWSASGSLDPPSHAALAPAYSGWPLVEADDRAFGQIGFFDDWVMHPRRDEFWAGVEHVPPAADAAAPTLLLAGWFDPFLPGMLADFMAIRQHGDPSVGKASRLIVGPWAHARSVVFPDGWREPSYRFATVRPSIPWYDRHAMGASNGADTPSVRLFVMGTNEWRDEEGWPLERAVPTRFYLRSAGAANSALGNGLLTLEAPGPGESPDQFVYDPAWPVPSAGGAMFGATSGIRRQNQVEERGDVLVYTTEPLQEDLEVTGPITLVLFVATSAPATDFTGKLVDVHPDGAAFNVTDGIFRGMYPEGDAPTRIEISLWPTSMVFFAGHRLRLEVSSSNFPRFDRHPNTAETLAIATVFEEARQTVFHEPGALSHLLLPLVPLTQGLD